MRIRQVKPSFWSDAKLATLPAPARLFYIGLWMQADDAGWLRWDTMQIANELYGYEPRARRERNVEALLAILVSADRVVVHPCGHVEIPTMTVHQRLGSVTKQVRTTQREHAECDLPAVPRGSPRFPGTVRNGKERNGKVNGTEQERVSAHATTTNEDRLPEHLRTIQ